MNNLEEALKKFSTAAMTAISNQIKSSPNFVLDKFYKGKSKATLSDSIDVIIKRGAGVVLESVSPAAEHLVQKTDDAYILTVSLPRFPLRDNLTAADISQLKSINNTDGLQESLTIKIADILDKQKRSIETTLEFMAVGSLFGKIMDGKGNVLFDFTSTTPAINFTSTKVIIKTLQEIDKAFVKEFGKNTPYDVLCGYDFLSSLADKATSEKLFENGTAKWENENNTRVLFVHGTKFIPYAASYKNTKGQTKEFLEANKAVAIPTGSDAFTLYYGRAVHTEALDKAPTLYFSAAPEKLANGAGYSIITESRAIPICDRPDGIVTLGFVG